MKKKLSKVLNSENSKLTALLQLIAFAFTRPGLKVITGALKKKFQQSAPPPDYDKWIRSQTNIRTHTENYNTSIKTLPKKPLISIFLAIDKPDVKFFATATHSIETQIYSSWELFFCNYQAQPDLSEIQTNSKIKFIHTDIPGMAPALNAAIQQAKGEYCLFMPPYAVLTPDCLFEFVKHLNQQPASALIYGDEDCIEDTGKYADHFFKPDWSPDTLLSRNYIGNTFLVSIKLLNTLNGLNENYESACLYDLLLRGAEVTYHIAHIPRILSHNTHRSGNVADTAAVKIVLQAALLRRGTPAKVEEISGSCCWQLNYEILQPGMVSIIIPTKDQAALLKIALNSILNKTNYANYEILIINNNSTTPEFFSLMDEYKSLLPGRFRVIDAPIPFNFSKLINIGAAASLGKYLLLLNNDIEVTDAGWLARMAGYAQQKHIGAAGVKLLYPDNTIQHAGIVLGIHGHSGHIFVNQPTLSTGYHNNLITTTNYSALTAACLMCRKEVYLEAGGMDENLPVEFNDIDLCLKFGQLGYYNVFLPTVTLYHHESATRGHPLSNLKSWRQHEHDLTIFKRKWQPYIDNDPFYNPNLSLYETDFRIKS